MLGRLLTAVFWDTWGPCAGSTPFDAVIAYRRVIGLIETARVIILGTH